MELMLPNKVNLYDEMKKQAKLHPKKIIIEDQNNSLTYEKFLITVNVLSKKIKEISLNEDRVGVYLPNVIGNIIVLFSMFKNEQSPCVLNFTMGTQSLLDCIETASLQTVLTSKEFIEAADLGTVVEEMEKKVKVIYLEDLKETISVAHKLIGLVEAKLPILTNKKQTDVVLFTSGTESKPKGVVLSHRNIFANIKQALAVIDATEEDKIFNALPLFHCFGLTVGAILPLVSNIKTFVYPSPLHYKEIPKYIKKDRSTILVGTNTFLDNYGRYSTREQLQSLRIVIAGAEKLKKDVQLKWKNEFGISILEGYGTTETSPIISLNTPQFTKEGTVGKIIPLLDYKIEPVEGISDGGSLLLKGPNVMQGYLIHGKGFVPCDEWYNTGDIVNIDKDGYIKIVARLKRFSKVAGEMVSLNKVEELALSCFGDSGFYAVSVPDTRKGERIILFTTSQGATEKELKKFIKQKKISSLYIPYKMEKIASVPLLGSGKPNYRELEDLAKTIKKGFFS